MRFAELARRTLALLLFVGLLLLTMPAPFAQPPERLTLRLDWTALGYHAPFFLGAARGYYKDAGIDLRILEGKGSSSTIELVGHGSDDFGFADATTAAKLISLGLPVKVVMGIFQRSTLSLFFPQGRGIKVPSDLKGKTVSMCPGDGLSVYLPAYLRAVNLSPEDVKIAMVDCSAKYVVVAQGRTDAVASYGTAGKPLLQNVGIRDVGKFDYADAGITLPSHGIVASVKTIGAKPDLVRKFMAATARSWTESRKNPDAAVEAMVGAFPLLKGKEAIVKATLEEAWPYLVTPRTEGRPFGWQSPEDWKAAEATLVQYVGIKPQASPDVYFTNDFVPK